MSAAFFGHKFPMKPAKHCGTFLANFLGHKGIPNQSRQGSTNFIFASTDFHVHKMVMYTRSCTQNYACIKKSL